MDSETGIRTSAALSQFIPRSALQEEDGLCGPVRTLMLHWVTLRSLFSSGCCQPRCPFIHTAEHLHG